MTALLLLCLVYCLVRGAWVVGVEVVDALAEIVAIVRGWRS